MKSKNPFSTKEIAIFKKMGRNRITTNLLGNTYVSNGAVFIRENNADNVAWLSEKSGKEFIPYELPFAFRQIKELYAVTYDEEESDLNPNYDRIKTLCIVRTSVGNKKRNLAYDKRYVEVIEKRSTEFKLINWTGSTLLGGYDKEGNLVGFVYPIKVDKEDYVARI